MNHPPEDHENNENNTVDIPHIGHTMGKGKRTNLLQNMPPGKDEIGWASHNKTIMAETVPVRVNNWPQCGHCSSLARPAITNVW
jgi:hypothetical protein